MQAHNYDGSFGPIEEFDGDLLQKRLADPNVKHVEVFEATEENIKFRKTLLGVKKRYQKIPVQKVKGNLMEMTLKITK